MYRNQLGEFHFDLWNWKSTFLQRAQWHSLLSTKYQRLKPEVKLMLSLEDDSQTKSAESQASAGHQQPTQQGDDSKLVELLELMINNTIQD